MTTLNDSLTSSSQPYQLSTDINTNELANLTDTTGSWKKSPVFYHLRVESLIARIDEARDFLLNVKCPVTLGMSKSWLYTVLCEAEK